MGIATTWRIVCHQFQANGIIVSTVAPESASGRVSVGPESRLGLQIGIHTCFTTLVEFSWQHSFLQ